jgi:capsular exopolysaccharide synthesis family protein
VKPDEHLVTLFSRSSPQVQQYKGLHHALEAMGASRALRVVAVTSPGIAEGKTTTAINLAGVSAHRNHARVLLIDADLRRPSVAERLGIADDGPGLVDAIVDADRTLENVVTYMPSYNLSILPAGRSHEDPYELFRTPRIAELLHDARRKFGFVVMDTAPLLLVPDSRALENWVDGVLLVVSAHRTPQKLVQEALNLLNPSKLIGLVFNRDDRPLSRYYGNYYGYVARTQTAATKIDAR